MTMRHCSGCAGYVSWTGECPGMTMGEFETPDVVPPLGIVNRLRALIGLPLLLGVTPDPPEPPDAGTGIFVSDEWDDGGAL